MIAVRLMGGLGNQMFEYAAARRLAIHNDSNLVIDISYYENQPENETPRHFEMDVFNIVGKVTKKPVNATPLGTIKLPFKKSLHTITEKYYHFDPSILSLGDNVLMIGYWQSEKYFKDQQKQIRKDFTYKVPLSPAKQRVADEIISSKSAISVQVRRGDYVNNPETAKFHGTMPLDYYKKAASIIMKSVKMPHFYVISDDPDWCRKNLKFGKYATTYVEHVPGTGHEDMRLTSLCKHHIIANSSFSWWGAWLNKKPNKIVVAPKQWFLDESIDASDVTPGSWIRV